MIWGGGVHIQMFSWTSNIGIHFLPLTINYRNECRNLLKQILSRKLQNFGSSKVLSLESKKFVNQENY